MALWDLALDIFDLVLDDNRGNNLGLKFTPSEIPTDNIAARNEFAERVMSRCSTVLGVTVDESTKNENWETLIENDINTAFVVTNGKTLTAYGPLKSGGCGIHIVGANAPEISDKITESLKKIGLNDVSSISASKLDFENEVWLEETYENLFDEDADDEEKEVGSKAPEEVIVLKKNPGEEIAASTDTDNPMEEIKILFDKTAEESGEFIKDFVKQVFLADKNEKMKANILKSYAKIASDEIPIFFYDNTLFGNGKSGFFVSSKNLYVGSHGRLKKKIPLNEINFIKAGTYIYNITINETEIDTALASAATIQLAKLIKEIIPLAKKL